MKRPRRVRLKTTCLHLQAAYIKLPNDIEHAAIIEAAKILKQILNRIEIYNIILGLLFHCGLKFTLEII